MSAPFAIRHFADGSTCYWERRHDRKVDPGYYLLQEFLAAGGVPDEEPYVAPPAPPPDPDEAVRKELENEYLAATRDLVMVADGKAPALGAKLSDKQFKQAAQKAANKDITATVLLLSTLQYTFFQLKLRGWGWEQIEYRPEAAR